MTGQTPLAADLNRFFVASYPEAARRRAIERMHWGEETAQDVELLLDHVRPWAQRGTGIPRDMARRLIARLEAHLGALADAEASD